MKEIQFYCIVREDGLFSTGGNLPAFHHKGKRWNTIGHVREHLTLVRSCGNMSVYDNCK